MTTAKTYDRRPILTPEAWRPFCDSGRLATPASDKVAADGYRDGLEGRDRLAEIVDGADRIVYRTAHASGALDREVDEQIYAQRARAHAAGRRAIAEFEADNRERLAAAGIVSLPAKAEARNPLPGWNFGSGSSGVVE